ncbi:MAG TPA: hypothetical protein RMH99_29745 [Sandaracinaceae bacterium LLY-WYZ-13_1]|nr:hypothetical protein [Sandaracinaceae bacterium LLY-WYZ-13_1]
MPKTHALLALAVLLAGCDDTRPARVDGGDSPGRPDASAPGVDGGPGGGTDGGPGASCSPSTCEGCCDGDVCRTGDELGACGTAGAACEACDATASCTRGVCEPVVVCAAGTESECRDLGEEWNDGACCVEGVTQCVEGDDYDCTTGRVGFHWTGSLCCVPTESLCVPGDDYDCGTGSTIEDWTGALCCVEGAVECSPSDSELDCTTGRTDRTFTGSQCCVVE